MGLRKKKAYSISYWEQTRFQRFQYLLPSTHFFPFQHLLPCLLIQEIVNIHHCFHMFLGSLPTLSSQSIVKLLWTWILPLGGTVSLGDRRYHSLCWQVDLLITLFFLRDLTRHQVETIEFLSNWFLVHWAAWWRCRFLFLLVHRAAWWWCWLVFFLVHRAAWRCVRRRRRHFLSNKKVSDKREVHLTHTQLQKCGQTGATRKILWL